MSAGPPRGRPRAPGLQPERTTLARQRTNLALLGCSLALVAGDQNFHHLASVLPAGLVGVLALVLLVVNRRRHASVARRPATDRPGTDDGRHILLTAVATLVLGVAALTTWLAARHQG